MQNKLGISDIFSYQPHENKEVNKINEIDATIF